MMNGRQSISGGRFLAMFVAGRLVSVAAAEIVQVLPMLPLWRPPTAPMPLLGFLGSGGGVLPVLSTRALLGLGDETVPGVYAHIVRVDCGGDRQVGLLVDRADGFVTPASLDPLSGENTLNGCAVALFSHGGTIGWLIDPSRLLGKAEGDMLAALVAEARRREDGWTTAT